MSEIPTRRLPPLPDLPAPDCPHCGTPLKPQEVQQWVPNSGGILPLCMTYARRACPRCAYREPVGPPLLSHWDQAANLIAALLSEHPAPGAPALRALVQHLRAMLPADEAMLAIWEGTLVRPGSQRAEIARLLERADTPYHPVAWFQQILAAGAPLWEAAAHVASDPFRQALAWYYQGLSTLFSEDPTFAAGLLETAYRNGSPALQTTYAIVLREETFAPLLNRRYRDPQAVSHYRRHEFRRRAGPVLRFLQGLNTLATQAPTLGLNLWLDVPAELAEWLDPFDEE